jgi:hypothetical protein
MASEPLAGTRMTKVTERKTKVDWAQFLQDIAVRRSWLKVAEIELNVLISQCLDALIGISAVWRNSTRKSQPGKRAATRFTPG